MVCIAKVPAWHVAIQTEQPLNNYPLFPWNLLTDPAIYRPVLIETKTISSSLVPLAHTEHKICPYGDKSALLAVIQKAAQPRLVRDAYTLSALRFERHPFPKKNSSPKNKIIGIPTDLQPLFKQKTSNRQTDDTWLQLPTLQALESAIDQRQKEMRSLYTQELAPLMNANPLDPSLYSHDLSPELVHDLKQYVALQNRPYLFFDLMQWIERDIATRRWRSAHAGYPITNEEAMIFVLNSWVDRDGTRRKRAIKCPTGVPLGYMQSVRRKNQPFITQEFADHAHGAFNHWLQEHIWQRFHYRYPEKAQLTPSQFFKQIGRCHFAFVDAISEMHMANVANPANTNFWSVLQFYLPFMSPWP